MTEPAEPSIPKACVMGHRVAYSRSPMIHNHWRRSLGLRGAYELMDVSPEAFPEFFRNLADRGYVGGNVTTPHKDAAFRLVDHREEAAEAIGAVNTVWYEGDRLVGGNTDFVGFLANLDEAAPGWDEHRAAVVIRAGGADGLGLLVHQAVPGFVRWFGSTPRVTAELRALLEADIRAKTAANTGA